MKAQLAADIGERHALRLYRILAARTLEAVRGVDGPVVVWYTPPEARAEMERWIGPGWDLRPQASGHQGARLAAASRAVPRGERWICVCRECPDLTADTLRDATSILDRVPIVLGPTVDGDLYLIGGWTPLPDVFVESKATQGTLRATRERLIQLGIPWEELLPLRDLESGRDAKAAGLLT
jgi:glycosyltransferase A (GT-A) superfamily protein (DUF2064 family)